MTSASELGAPPVAAETGEGRGFGGVWANATGVQKRPTAPTHAIAARVTLWIDESRIFPGNITLFPW
jgi:hypothetical protein